MRTDSKSLFWINIQISKIETRYGCTVLEHSILMKISVYKDHLCELMLAILKGVKDRKKRFHEKVKEKVHIVISWELNQQISEFPVQN